MGCTACLGQRHDTQANTASKPAIGPQYGEVEPFAFLAKGLCGGYPFIRQFPWVGKRRAAEHAHNLPVIDQMVQGRGIIGCQQAQAAGRRVKLEG